MDEKWDRESARIVTVQALTKPVPDILPEIQQSFNAGWEIALRVCQTADPELVREIAISTSEDRCDFLHARLVTLGREDDVDAAFWHALYGVNFLPR